MKRIFNTLGLLCLILISFVYTEKSMMVVREYDSIMIKIKEQKNIDCTKSTIIDDTIIPGILEKQINQKESYKKMKQYGNYNDKLLVYKHIDNETSLKNNLDKYIISGNKSKNMISLIFILKWNSDIGELIKIIDNYNIQVSFVVDNKWINKEIIQLLAKRHTIINGDYNKIKETNRIIKNVFNQNKLYCYAEEKNTKLLEKCKKNNSHTILPIFIENNLLINTKKNIQSGSILSYEVNNNLIKELEGIIKYINNKGFMVTNLIEHLEE